MIKNKFNTEFKNQNYEKMLQNQKLSEYNHLLNNEADMNQLSKYRKSLQKLCYDNINSYKQRKYSSDQTIYNYYLQNKSKDKDISNV
jgi:hypothetical protein